MKKTLLNEQDKNEIIERINRLTPETQHQWGKMEVAQMLAHCAKGLEMTLGDFKATPAPFPMRIVGRLMKWVYTNDKPFHKNSPTDKNFLVSERKDFTAEKNNLIGLLNRFYAGGESGITKNHHPFFGYFTPAEWGIGSYKHLDHHLRQFGA
jgi:hypothetical protein